MRNPKAGMNRYWGRMAPPSSKAEFFDAITTPAPSGEGTVATIRLYGPIDSWGGWWGISATDVSDVLDALPDTVTRIVLRINSPGGEVWEALSILNMFRAHKATVTAVVDGLAASAGSFLAVGCDETVMSPGTQMMIHSPLSWTYGNAEELRKVADILDTIEESIITIYRDKAGASAWGELLHAETWYTAEQAVDAGLANRVAVVQDAGETKTAGVDDPDPIDVPDEGDVEDRYAAAYTRLRHSAHMLPSSSEPGTTNRKESVVDHDNFVAGIRERLGVTDAAASEEAVLAALDEALTEQADTPAATPAATIPAGTQLIENGVLDQLRADASAGREARDQQIRDRRDGIIDTATREGRISAASAPSFRKMLDQEGGEAAAIEALNSLAKNTIPVDEIGHAAGEVSAEDALYAKYIGETEEN